MPTLDTTVGGANANSYCSLADAATFHDDSLYGSAWTVLDDDDQKTRALITATRLLDEQYDFIGNRATTTQRLKWPRSAAYDLTAAAITGVYGIDAYAVPADEIPRAVREATAELAKWLLASDRTEEQAATSGVKRVKAGSVEVEYELGARQTVPVVPSIVLEMLRPFLTRAAGDGMVPLARV